MQPSAWKDRASRREPGRTGRVLRTVGAVALGALVLALLDGRLVDMPDWLDGGRSDPAPRGSVTYEGQEARTASERFLVDIGDGEATVAVKAKQNHDSYGWIINGDFQSTNGTSSVSDPDDHDSPARLAVTVDYCADGEVTLTEAAGDEGSVAAGDVVAVAFDMGELVVCDTTLEHTSANDAAFNQDDTPRDFHGDFVSFVARATEVVAAASACPADELERYRSDDYLDFVAGQLAARHGVAVEDVEVTAGEIGTSDRATRDELRTALDRVAALRDPDDPSVTYEALSVQYLAGDGEAVADACYLDAGGRDLDELEAPPSD